MSKKKLMIDYYNKYCQNIENYSAEYSVVSVDEYLGSIVLKHEICGNIFAKKKNNYMKRIFCNNKECEDKRRLEFNLKKYGCNNPFQNKDIKEKIRQTNLEKYGVENVSQAKEIQEKREKTFLKKYGETTPFKNKEFVEKIEAINLNKFGVKRPFQNKEIRDKSKKTHFEKYEIENPLQSEEIRRKAQKTLVNNYGVSIPAKNSEIKKRMIQTNLERYGVKNPAKNKEIINKIKRSQLDTFYVNTILKFKNIVPLFNINEYYGVRNDNKNTYYRFECLTCGVAFENYLAKANIPKCPNCFPKLSGTSKTEKEIQIWLKESITMEKNKRFYVNGIYRYELDIFLPEKNIGIELNGIYWHSEISGNKDRKYHIDKLNWFKEQGIQVIQIWNSEWIEKQDIIKSIILSKLGLIRKNIYARKCTIKDVNPKDSGDFLDDNHLQGRVGASIKLGLYFEDKLVSLLTFGKPRFNKKYDWEIIRFCNKTNTNVVGGFSKLLKHFIKKNNPKSLITYADKRFSNGKLYENNGFEKVGESKPNYFYTKDYLNLETRVQYQKHKLKDKLETFNPELTEWENMQQNGFDRIWDCGNLSFDLSL